MSWKNIKLGDLCKKITDGSHNPPAGIENSEYIMLSSKNVIDDEINFHAPRFISKADFEQENKRTDVNPGDVLLTIVGTVGRVAVVPEGFPKITLQRSVAVLKPNNTLINSRFLMYSLRNILDVLMEGARGVAQKGIYLKTIRDIKISVPPLEEQKRIAAILDKADALRRKREKAIALTDDLLRAVFLDIFGDPITNPKGFKIERLKDLAHIQIGPFGTQLHKEDYIQNGIPLINPKHIIDGEIVSADETSITAEKHSSLPEYHLQVGDIIMGRRGEMGRCALVSKKEEGWMCGTGSLYIRPNNVGVFSEYLCKFLSSNAIKKHLEGESLGATMPNLNKTIVGNIRVPVPDCSSLEGYATKRRKFEEYAEKIRLFSNNELFYSLIQRAFRGELTTQKEAA